MCIRDRVRAGLEGISDISSLILAYEPIWAIGTGQAATPDIAAEIMGGAVLDTLKSLYTAKADDVPLLYGGSMNAGNAGDFAAQDCIHGGLVGGAALQADSFLAVAVAVAAAKA